MDLKIDKRKTEIVQKVETSEAPVYQQDDLEDDDLRPAPMTRERLREMIEEGLESIRQGKVYTTEEVLAYLDSDVD